MQPFSSYCVLETNPSRQTGLLGFLAVPLCSFAPLLNILLLSQPPPPALPSLPISSPTRFPGSSSHPFISGRLSLPPHRPSRRTPASLPIDLTRPFPITPSMRTPIHPSAPSCTPSPAHVLPSALSVRNLSRLLPLRLRHLFLL